jgi:hypothetical protein
MRPGRPFYCALLLDSELDSNLNCFWPPPRGLEPDQPWTSLLTWKPLLDFFYSIPCTNHGRMHGCHVLIITLSRRPNDTPARLPACPRGQANAVMRLAAVPCCWCSPTAGNHPWWPSPSSSWTAGNHPLVVVAVELAAICNHSLPCTQIIICTAFYFA